ncbi:MAG: hypothetical protein Q7T96_18400 [Methylobacter sp.]|nr:hypothetical protein [Methylobacter sp.]
MTNAKEIDVSEIPVTERLTIARKLDAGEKVEFHGCTVVNNGNAKAKAEALAGSSAIHRLTMARKSLSSKNDKPNELPESPAGYVDFDPETGACLGFVSYDNEQL